MKDNFSLIAATAGGFMLSVALSGILQGGPVTSWQASSNVNSFPVFGSRLIAAQPNDKIK